MHRLDLIIRKRRECFRLNIKNYFQHNYNVIYYYYWIVEWKVNRNLKMRENSIFRFKTKEMFKVFCYSSKYLLFSYFSVCSFVWFSFFCSFSSSFLLNIFSFSHHVFTYNLVSFPSSLTIVLHRFRTLIFHSDHRSPQWP